jgi:hypothetical protein
MNPRPWIVAALLAISIGAVYGWAVSSNFGLPLRHVTEL